MRIEEALTQAQHRRIPLNRMEREAYKVLQLYDKINHDLIMTGHDPIEFEVEKEPFVYEEGGKTKEMKYNSLVSSLGMYELIRELIEPKYERFVAMDAFMNDNRSSPGMREVSWGIVNHHGEASYEATGTRKNATSVSYGTNTNYPTNIYHSLKIAREELEASRFAFSSSKALPIDIIKDSLMALRKQVNQLLEKTVFLGSDGTTANKRTRGFFDWFSATKSSDTATILDASGTGTGKHWANKDIDAIISTDLANMLKEVIGDGKYMPDTMLIDRRVLIDLGTQIPAIGSGTDKATVAEFTAGLFKKALLGAYGDLLDMKGRQEMISRVKIIPTNMMNEKYNGISSSGSSVVLYERKYWRHLITQLFTLFTPERQDGVITQQGRFITAGIGAVYPNSAVLMTNVGAILT